MSVTVFGLVLLHCRVILRHLVVSTGQVVPLESARNCEPLISQKGACGHLPAPTHRPPCQIAHPEFVQEEESIVGREPGRLRGVAFSGRIVLAGTTPASLPWWLSQWLSGAGRRLASRGPI